MNCKFCKLSQENNRYYYYRWGKAIISFSACDEHAREIIEALNKAQQDDRA